MIRGGRNADSRGRNKGGKSKPRDDLATETYIEYGGADVENAVAFTDSEEILTLRASAMSHNDHDPKDKSENEEIENINVDGRRERGSTRQTCRKVIVKQTSFDVTYKVKEGPGLNADGTRLRDEMWMAKELPKIPWEGHNEWKGPDR